jgi:serine/threonine protein kinase
VQPGSHLGHYEILATVGKGGMGEVYKARDTKLGREVAIKTLPAEFAADAERLARFEREGRLLASLNHPDIVTIHSVEEADGVHFLTMELVEGQSLADILTEEGVDLDRLFEIALPLTEALAAAHAKGITHRDLKPQNIMITRQERPKILDFGLAKFAQGDESQLLSEMITESQTQAGMIVGTVPYMSPEQIQGRRVDRRSDIFSLGIVLFEMATGRRPFTGDSSIELLSGILKDQPPSASDLRPEVPEGVSRIIGRCLAKDPEDRYQDAAELNRAISRMSQRGGATSAGDRAAPSEAPWLAVLPFRKRAGDPDLEALADGLIEDIITGLSRFPHLFVVSASSSSRYAGRATDVRTIGQELGARYIIEGGLRKAGGNVRVSVQLLDAATGTHRWAEHFDRNLGDRDILAAQDELTDRIVATVADSHSVLTRSMAASVKHKPISELTAYECVLRVLDYQQRLAPEEHAELREALESALQREPSQAEAWGWLGWLYCIEFKFRYDPRPDSLDRGLRAAQRAIEIDPTTPAGHFALAHVQFVRRELPACRAAVDRLLALNPRDSVAMSNAGLLIACSGDWDKGIELIRGAMALNPNHAAWLHVVLAWDFYQKRDYEKAVEEAGKKSMPGFYKAECILAAANAQLGWMKAARRHVTNLLSLRPDFAKDAVDDLSREFVPEDFVEHYLEGLAKAGLDIEGYAPEPTGESAAAQTDDDCDSGV